MSEVIEALHIYDEHNRPILSHIYTGRPLSAQQLLPLYLAEPQPRPSLIYLPNTSPPTLVFSYVHSNLLFALTASTEIEPLLALEFLHRIIDVLEEFVGSPLLAHKVESSYDVVAQLLNEMCDAGAVGTTEPNALRDLVEVEGLIGKLLGGISIPGKAGFSSASSSSNMPGISSSGNASTPSVPWRRANVRHTSNELYVDIVETLCVTFAPSGRPLAAFANGTIAFTSKISGVPDILLSLSTPSGKQNINGVMELPVFHPCVRLARWREKPGELSFVPPDGRFVLAGYEVDLLPFQNDRFGTTSASNLKLPVQLEVKTGLGSTGSDFEVRLLITKVSGQGNSSISGSSSRGGGGGFGGGLGQQAGTSSTPTLEDLVVTVPLPTGIRNLSEIRASRGDTTYNPGEKQLEWSIPAKEAVSGGASLRCTIAGPLTEDDDFESNGFRIDGRYDYDDGTYQSTPVESEKVSEKPDGQSDARKVEQNKILMPSSTSVSFAIKGWLASGIKVESLKVDTRKSRGLGEGVKPYKGVKYLTISRSGIEVRC
ncbi:Adaptor complexes medium subunit family-domain-containing protein [Amylocarpus encephaloides]|uniref:Adaptor complexes medium subunit family-domain-containing protein n=1 Tax=Amylocarpus encephaloides TaxID=45428 RepID=A0A9P7YQX1_9HELO|nr:Adaptor complexes medium subunit family-domain-containing protein [Amylocarpus encephaloides]